MIEASNVIEFSPLALVVIVFGQELLTTKARKYVIAYARRSGLRTSADECILLFLSQIN